MRSSFISSTVLLAAIHGNAHPTPEANLLDEGNAGGLTARQNDHVVTTGASGATHTRLEIRQLYSKQPDQWSLFIQAMQQFMKTGTSDATSYYQIAGIHGLPRQDFDGVSRCKSCRGANGYCTHSSVLFPAWHRAYVALWEQEFLQVVQEVAVSYPAGKSRATMQAAADTMRFPFWDWAASPSPGSPVTPDLITNTTLSINTPSGQQTIANPLYTYSFPEIDNLNDKPYTVWPETLRYPDSNTSSANSQESSLIDAFKKKQPSLKDRLHNMFSTCTDYLHFSNDHAGSSSTRCSTSIEAIHNTVHTLCGGPTTNIAHGGHMTFLSVAAFDPLFWLHHTNIDRLFALWQTMNPNSYGASQAAVMNTWTIPKGSVQGPDSPLMPFRSDDNGDFWTTNEVRDWSATFHYTYPEYVDSSGDRKAIATYINNLYGSSATATAGSSKRQENANDALTDSDGATFQYIANVHAPRFGLDGSYSIHLFLGHPESEDPASWLRDLNSIDMIGVVSRKGMQNNDLIIADSVPLTRGLTAIHLRDNNILESLSVSQVVPYLRANLQWRILGPDGNAVDPGSLEGFQIGVFAASSQVSSSEGELPTWSSFVGLPSVTEGRPGGAAPGAKVFAP